MKYTKILTTIAIASGVMGAAGLNAHASVNFPSHHAAATQDNRQKAIDAVNALFTDSTHTKLAPGVTMEQIHAAKKLVMKYVPASTGELKTMYALCMKAENLFNSTPAVNPGLQKTIDAVNALFTDSTHTKLAPGVNKETIKAAEVLILKNVPVPQSALFNQLYDLCKQATKLLSESTTPTDAKTQAAVDAVNALFTDSTHTKLAAGVNAETIKAAQRLILKNVPISQDTLFNQLAELCKQAKKLLNESTVPTDAKTQAAVDAVNALFTDSSHTKLAAGVTKETIKEATRLVLKNVPLTSNALFHQLADLLSKANSLL